METVSAKLGPAIQMGEGLVWQGGNKPSAPIKEPAVQTGQTRPASSVRQPAAVAGAKPSTSTDPPPSYDSLPSTSAPPDYHASSTQNERANHIIQQHTAHHDSISKQTEPAT